MLTFISSPPVVQYTGFDGVSSSSSRTLSYQNRMSSAVNGSPEDQLMPGTRDNSRVRPSFWYSQLSAIPGSTALYSGEIRRMVSGPMVD